MDKEMLKNERQNNTDAADRPDAEFRFNPIQLVVGVLFVGAGIAILLANIGQPFVAIVSIVYGLRSIVAFTHGRVKVYADRVEIVAPVARAIEPIRFETVTDIKRKGSGLAMQLDNSKKPFVIPWWIIGSTDIDRLTEVLQERWQSRLAKARGR